MKGKILRFVYNRKVQIYSEFCKNRTELGTVAEKDLYNLNNRPTDRN